MALATTLAAASGALAWTAPDADYAACGIAGHAACQQHDGSFAPSRASTLYYAEHLPRALKTRPDHLTYVEAEYSFGVVADLDLMSRDPQDFIWRSYLKKGRVIRASGRLERERFTITMDSELELTSYTATRNRSMELSELVLHHRLLIAFCDYSGIAYKIDPRTGQTFQRWAIADGDGDETKPFKGEWATVIGDTIWLGSIGFEWYGKDGTILHRNAEWVKLIDSNGLIRNLNWHPVYQAIRSATNTVLPGYMWHEAVEWAPVLRRWVMLPRFASTTSRYIPGAEHNNTANLLIVADEGFTNIQVKRLAHHDPRFGFTSVKRLPGSHDLFMVLRVEEAAGGTSHRTQAAVLDLEGQFYTDPPYIDVGDRKFEGLAFL